MSLGINEENSCTNKELVHTLNTIIPFFWLVIGTSSNCLTITVFSRKQMKKNSTFHYLYLMTWCDLAGNFRICSISEGVNSYSSTHSDESSQAGGGSVKSRRMTKVMV